jgi:hypothetical protein
MNADEHGSDASGRDLDAWGGETTTPILIPRRGGDEPCPLKIEGRCPVICGACAEFEEEMKLVVRGENGE